VVRSNLACTNQCLPKALPAALRSIASHHPGRLAMETAPTPEPCSKGKILNHPNTAASAGHPAARERQTLHHWLVSDAKHPELALKGPRCPSSYPLPHRPDKLERRLPDRSRGFHRPDQLRQRGGFHASIKSQATSIAHGKLHGRRRCGLRG
jgi:hypothetical protein